MDPASKIRNGLSAEALDYLSKLAEPRAAEPKQPTAASGGGDDGGATSRVALKDSASARLFARRADPSQTGAQGAPSAERPAVAPGIKSNEEIIACKVVIGSTAAFVAGLATPVTLGTATMAALGKAVVGGVGTGAALSVCENAPQKTEDQGAGGAPGAR